MDTKDRELHGGQGCMTPLDKVLSISERNERFDAMTPRERRIAVAEDVILQVQEGRYSVSDRMGYFTLTDAAIRIIGDDWWHRLSFQETADFVRDYDLTQQVPPCKVCARGAAVVSAAGLFDRVNPRAKAGSDPRHIFSAGGEREFYEKLFFSPFQSHLIEAAFEMDTSFVTGTYVSKCAVELAERAVMFGRRYMDDPAERMIAIFQNVINNGKFVPPAWKAEHTNPGEE